MQGPNCPDSPAVHYRLVGIKSRESIIYIHVDVYDDHRIKLCK